MRKLIQSIAFAGRAFSTARPGMGVTGRRGAFPKRTRCRSDQPVRGFRERSVSGFSLIEITAVSALATGLAFASLRLLDAVTALREGAQAEMQTFRSLHRLADQLRSDAHPSDDGRTENDATILLLADTDGERTVRYEIVESSVRRIVEDETSSNVIAREGFQLPQNAVVRWSVDDEASLVRLQVTSQRPGTPGFSIEAVLGRETQQ